MHRGSVSVPLTSLTYGKEIRKLHSTTNNFHLLKISVLWNIVDSFDVMEQTKYVQVNAESLLTLLSLLSSFSAV